MGDDQEFFSKAKAEFASGIDRSVPHSARIWNYWLGGKDNFPVDRVGGDKYAEIFPGITDIARLTRYFLKRSVGFLAGEARVRQFLDVGTGLPTVDNTHEVAQRVAPASRIVYIDNDPMVLVHAHALLTSTPEGATDYVEADMRDPAAILAGAARTLDLDEPVGLTFMGVLGHIVDDQTAVEIVSRLMAALPSGSFLAIADGATHISSEFAAAQRDYDEGGSVPYKLRDREQVRDLFAGYPLLEPGLVPCLEWRPETTLTADAPQIQPLAGIAHKE
ncbi:SAM-dependent methyltransferase [Spirillospora sp. CA-294931]|uniref:SAM-dependent methyltransferase n=1 Tax=Spirillospora sp. CA-294931 TaxID=3240042 RepID=UPI003D914C7C